MEQIDDVRILKEKILKIDSIFTLIAEKQSRIKVLETKNKKEVREINALRSKNNELLTELEKSQKMQEQTILDSSKRYAVLQKSNEATVKLWRKRLMKYKNHISKKNKQFQKNAEEKYSRNIYILQKTITYLRRKLSQRVLSESIGKKSKIKEGGKEINILQNILINPSKKEAMEVETQTEEDIQMEEYYIDAMLMEMTYLPDLMHPFGEEHPPKAMQSIQTQTMRSTVTRPVQTYQQTSDMGLQCNLTKNDHIKSLCALIQAEKENVKENQTRSFSIQTDIFDSVESKSTQTNAPPKMVTSSSQTTCRENLFAERKITLKNAVAALKKSRQCFTISNGMLIHYSKQPISGRGANEALVAKSVFRRLAKYIDTQYGGLDSKKRRRMSNILCETKQLERSRELMRLYRSGFVFSPNSDTESSGYESRIRRNSRFLEADVMGGSKAPSCDSGITSEVDQMNEDVNERDVALLLDEILVDVPMLISPLDDQESEVNDHQSRDLKMTETEEHQVENEVFVELDKPKHRKRPVKNRLLAIRSKIKKCNQVNVTRMAKDDKVCLPSKTRQALRNNDTKNANLLNVQSKTANTDSELIISNVENRTIALSKVTVNEEFQRMKNRCNKSKANTAHINLQSNNDNICAEQNNSHKSQTKLKAEDILSLLTCKDDKKTSLINASETNLEIITENKTKLNSCVKSEVLEVGTNAMTTRSGRTFLRPVRKLVSNISQNDAIASHKNDNMSPSCLGSSISLENTVLKQNSGPPSSESVKTTRSGRAFGQSDTPPRKSILKTKNVIKSIENDERGTKRKRGRPPNIKQENTLHNSNTESLVQNISETNSEPMACEESSVTKKIPKVETTIESAPVEETSKEVHLTVKATIIQENSEIKSKDSTMEIDAVKMDTNIENVTVSQQDSAKSQNALTDENTNEITSHNEKEEIIISQSPAAEKLPKDETNIKQKENTGVLSFVIPLLSKSPEIDNKEIGVDIQNIVMNQQNSENSEGKTNDESQNEVTDENDSSDSDTEISCNTEKEEISRSSKGENVANAVIKDQPKKITFRTFKKALETCVWFRGDSRICQDEIQLIKSIQSPILVNFIIQCLLSDQSPLEKSTGSTSMEPLLTTKQKVVIGLLVRFEHDAPNSGFLAQLITNIERYLLFNKKQDVESLEYLSRFYTALCRLQQNKHKVRTFLSDLLYIAPMHKFSIIYTIVTSWLNVLQTYNAESMSGAGIDRVLVHTAMTTPITPPTKGNADNQQDNYIGVMRNLFVTYYKYPNEPQCVDDLIMSLLESYMCDGFVQFEAAILILCAYGTPQWTYEKVQLIGELCKVSVDEQVVRNLLKLIANIAKKLMLDYKDKVYANLTELFLHFGKSKVSMKLDDLKQLCLNR